MVKVPLKVKRAKKGGERTSWTSHSGEETFRVSADAILDLTLVSWSVHLSFPSAPRTTTGQGSSFTDPLNFNLSPEHDQIVDLQPSHLNSNAFVSRNNASDLPPPADHVTISSEDGGSQ